MYFTLTLLLIDRAHLAAHFFQFVAVLPGRKLWCNELRTQQPRSVKQQQTSEQSSSWVSSLWTSHVYHQYSVSYTLLQDSSDNRWFRVRKKCLPNSYELIMIAHAGATFTILGTIPEETRLKILATVLSEVSNGFLALKSTTCNCYILSDMLHVSEVKRSSVSHSEIIYMYWVPYK